MTLATLLQRAQFFNGPLNSTVETVSVLRHDVAVATWRHAELRWFGAGQWRTGDAFHSFDSRITGSMTLVFRSMASTIVCCWAPLAAEATTGMTCR